MTCSSCEERRKRIKEALLNTKDTIARVPYRWSLGFFAPPPPDLTKPLHKRFNNVSSRDDEK